MDTYMHIFHFVFNLWFLRLKLKVRVIITKYVMDILNWPAFIVDINVVGKYKGSNAFKIRLPVFKLGVFSSIEQ